MLRSNTMVILHARVPIKPESRERWLALLAAVSPPSRAEEACQSYIVYEAVEAPNSSSSSRNGQA
jgi:quinol monooxygenase YgiN